MAVDAATWLQGESTPAPETPAPSVPAEAEAPAPARVETPPSVPDPAPAPSLPEAPPPVPNLHEFTAAAERVHAAKGALERQHAAIVAQETKEQERIQELLDQVADGAIEQERVQARIQKYQAGRAERERQVYALGAQYREADALGQQIAGEYQRVQRDTRFEPVYARVAYELLADDWARKSGDPATFDRAAFIHEMQAAKVDANALEPVAKLVAEKVRAATAAARAAAGIDHMGGAGGGTGSGLDYTKMSSHEMAAKAAESMYGNADPRGR